VTSGLHAALEERRRVLLRYESSLVEALKAEAIVGEGIAWLPESMIRTELQSGVLTIIGDEASTIPLELWLFRPSAAMRSAVSADALALKMDDMMDTPPMSESVSYPQVKRP
jgi:DNA-binding transcriptional LysR family regulator